MPAQDKPAETLGATQQAISTPLEVIGIVQKQESWVPYDLKPPETLEAVRSTAPKAKSERSEQSAMWYTNQPDETITGKRYQQQVMQLSEALKLKPICQMP
ncbi:hypothetical protein RB195_007579 [Necator americanus]|uniref:Uncharacterized protein n=1 Tax=Necator americanus TaxID=51031 RepID=A0ABR1BY19_NECAM